MEQNINTQLRKSFSLVKQDISELERKQQEEGTKVRELRKALDRIEESKQPQVNIEQINSLNKRVQDLNSSLRKLWDIENDVKKIDSTKVNEAKLDKEVKRVHELLKIKSEQVDATLSQFGAKQNQFLTREQTRKLLDDIGEEITDLWKEVKSIQTTKDQITLQQLNKRSEQINERITALANAMREVSSNAKALLSKAEFNTFVRDLNDELETLKSRTEDVAKLKIYMTNLSQEFLSVDDFNEKIREFNSAVDSLQRDTNTFRKETPDRKELNKLLNEVKNTTEKRVDVLESTLNRRITDFNSAIDSIRTDTNIFRRDVVEKREFSKSLDQLDYRLLKMQAQIDRLQKHEGTHSMVSPKEVKAEMRLRKESTGLLVFGNMLIIAGFIALASGVITYFMDQIRLTNYFAVGAIVIFVVGLLIRIIALSKRR